MTVGELLIQTRIANGLTIKDAVEKTYIQEKFIIALERNDYATIPAETYIKGFLQIYGGYLGIDTVELREMYQATKDTTDIISEEEYEFLIKNRVAVPKTEAGRVPTSNNVGADRPPQDVVNTEDPSKPVAIQTATRKTTNSNNTVGGTGADKVKSNSSDYKKNIGANATLNNQEMSFKEKIAMERSKKSTFSRQKVWIVLLICSLAIAGWLLWGGSSNDGAVKLPTTPTNGAVPITTNGVELSGKVIESCWVNIEADGKKVFEGTLNAGENFSWQAKERLSVHIGNIRAFSGLQLNKKPFAFEGVPGNVVKRELTVKDIK